MDKETVKKIAEIAKIELDEKEISEIGKELERILEYFSKIKELKGGKEVYYVHEIENPLREDKKEESKEEERIVGQFTKKEGKYLSAPKAIK